MTTQTKDDRTSRQTIMDAIQELTGLGHSLTRDNLQAATGLTMHIIDDHVSRMVDVECQSASNSFQVSASKFFQLLRLI